MTNLLSYYISQTVRRNAATPRQGSTTKPKLVQTLTPKTMNLSTQNSEYKVQTVTRSRYLETFKVFQKMTDEYDGMTTFIARQLKTRFSGPFSLLDIGAGSGHLVKKLNETQCLENLATYTAIEPDATAAAALLREMQNFPNVRSLVEVERFDQAVARDLQQTFDVILLSHSLYGMANPIDALMEAKKLLAPGGVLLVIHNTAFGLNKLFAAINPFLDRDTAPIENFDLDSAKITYSLRQANATFEVTPITTTIDVTDLFDGTRASDEKLAEFLSFATQCEIAKAPSYVREDVAFLLRAACVTVDGRLMLPQSMAGFVIY